MLFGLPTSQIVHHREPQKKHFEILKRCSVDSYRLQLDALSICFRTSASQRNSILGLATAPRVLDDDVRSLVGNCIQHMHAIRRKSSSASGEEIRFVNNIAEPLQRLDRSLRRLDPDEKLFSEQLDILGNAFSSQTTRFRNPNSISETCMSGVDLQRFTADLLRTGQRDVLASLSEMLVKLWKKRCYCPVPERVTTCGPVTAESVNVRVPVTGPVAVGEKVTPIVQVAPAPMLAPQVLLATLNPGLALMVENGRELLR